MKMTKHPLGTLVETDVLVIGSGASGCGAALGARDQGLDVVLMDKGKLESSGCIGGGNDDYMAVLMSPVKPTTPWKTSSSSTPSPSMAGRLPCCRTAGTPT